MKTKVVVGIPSLNEEDSISNVVVIIDEGLVQIFPSDECIILNIDSGSIDATKSAFLNTKTSCPKHHIDASGKNRGKGKNLLKLIQYSQSVNAELVSTFDADLLSIEPEWVLSMFTPIINKSCDYVCPLYSRNRFEGSTTNHLAFPLIYANFGVAIRQPIGGEFAMRRIVADYIFAQSRYSSVFQYGIDIFMTYHALGGGFRVGETFLGKKFHKPSFPKIMPMFSQVAQTILECTRMYSSLPNQVSYVDLKSVIRSGIDEQSSFAHKKNLPALLKDATENFNRQSRRYNFFLGDFYPVVEERLHSSTPKFSMEEWAETLLRFVFRFSEKSISQRNRKWCGQLLAQIFIWRAATFWLEAENLSATETESRVLAQAEIIRQGFIKRKM